MGQYVIQDHLAALARKVQGYALLVPINAHEPKGLPSNERGPPSAGIVASLSPLDLNDLGPQVSKKHGRGRAGYRGGQIEDAHAFEQVKSFAGGQERQCAIGPIMTWLLFGVSHASLGFPFHPIQQRLCHCPPPWEKAFPACCMSLPRTSF